MHYSGVTVAPQVTVAHRTSVADVAQVCPTPSRLLVPEMPGLRGERGPLASHALPVLRRARREAATGENWPVLPPHTGRASRPEPRGR
jgi:hypothetical protein